MPLCIKEKNFSWLNWLPLPLSTCEDVPRRYCTQYGESLPSTFRLKVRTGYEFSVDFDKGKQRISGLSLFYKHFGLKGGESLVFEYCGGYKFNLFILGVDFAEIEYPSIVHHFQTCQPVPVRIHAGGWKFSKFISLEESVLDKIAVPTGFVKKFPEIPVRQNFMICNGQKFVGSYNSNDNTLNGFGHLRRLLGVSDLNIYSVLLFTYDGGHVFQTTIFDERMVEILFPPLGRCSRGVRGNLTVVETSLPVGERLSFEITVKPFHMYEYCHGVDISMDFFDLVIEWERKDEITVYQGDRRWPLEIRKRKNWKRTTIHYGWIEFRDDLELQIGDVCVFTTMNQSVKEFTVEVRRAV
ncbi:hypothetical protein POM88_052740 [Heracleum sosnowskyi]|uniref:TF-B3 domain-containing protein n=1 Tax=Heracleum sosnowskyi TaxID=360622 RepID=A0AAD8GR92_9APIA|nr:hypothetical protein POM88_052740 [Heracleum sosnowskyi]